jgi:hypothetical protein
MSQVSSLPLKCWHCQETGAKIRNPVAKRYSRSLRPFVSNDDNGLSPRREQSVEEWGAEHKRSGGGRVKESLRKQGEVGGWTHSEKTQAESERSQVPSSITTCREELNLFKL